jgi:CRP-like cAMP-binding protein
VRHRRRWGTPCGGRRILYPGGKVKLTVVSQQGKEAVVAILKEGSFFGESCLAGQTVRPATATALEDCSLVRIDKGTMIRVLHDEPTFTEMFLSYLLAHTTRIQEDLVDHLFNSSEKRLARMLLLLAHFGERRQAAVGDREGQSGNARRDDRHHALPRQFLHE